MKLPVNNSRFFTNLKSNKKNVFIIISILILITTGSFLRAYGLNKVYTEYDDIGVIAAHKSFIGSKTVNPIQKFINYPLTVDRDFVYSIENTALLPFYIAYIWTYAPGQYVLLSVLNSEDDSFDTAVYKGRIISVIFSVASIFLLVYLMYIINRKVLIWTILVVTLLPIFSANSILYAHHMSPYSAYVFSMSLGLVLLYKYSISNITFRRLIISLGFLFYLSWFTILFAFPVLTIYLSKVKSNCEFYSSKKYTGDFFSILISIFITLPGLIILETKSSTAGIMPPEINGISSIIEIINHLIRQIFVSMKSILFGFIRHDYLFISLFGIICFLSIRKLINYCKKTKKESGVYVFALLIIVCQWVILHLFGSLPLDETRHVLVLLPVITLIIFYVVKDINLKNRNYKIFIGLIIFLASISSAIYSMDLLKSKYSNFDYNYLNDRDEKVILLYKGTLGPLKYYEKSQKQVYFIEVNSFRNNYLDIDFPEKILLVGQRDRIINDGLYDKYQKDLPGLFCNYSIHTLYEKQSKTFFNYNNYPQDSDRNGMFVYQLRKTDVNQCKVSLEE